MSTLLIPFGFSLPFWHYKNVIVAITIQNVAFPPSQAAWSVLIPRKWIVIMAIIVFVIVFMHSDSLFTVNLTWITFHPNQALLNIIVLWFWIT